jgi:hypothetical protein
VDKSTLERFPEEGNEGRKYPKFSQNLKDIWIFGRR